MWNGIGAALVAAGCAWTGFRAAAALGERVRALEDMSASLALLEQELELDNPPLPQLMERLAGRAGGDAGEFFGRCRAGLDRLDEEEFSRLWRRLVGECRALGEEERRCLAGLGGVLGRCGAQAQVRAVDAALVRLREVTARAEARALRQRGIYRALGLSGGAFLVILLL